MVDKLDDEDDEVEKNRKVPVIKGSSTGGGAKIGGEDDIGSAIPEQKWQLHNVPVFYGRNDNDRPNVDRWDNRIPPVAVWTTEPNYYLHNNYNPNRSNYF